ncbi:MAG: DsbA family protein [Proteobacteria bacterium]|nr:DsbA family protein [Pseudomonadota bacterium]
MLNRRHILTALPALIAAPALAQKKAPAKPATESDHGWFRLRSDEGKPFPNLRLPVEITRQLDNHPGMIRTGSTTPDVTLIEFSDFNCPWCRKSAKDMQAMIAADSDLRIGLIANPILSAGSKEAALVELAVLKNHGRVSAHTLHTAMFSLTGFVDGKRALGVARDLGLDDAALANAAAGDPELKAVLDRQMKLAESLALAVTPSYVIGDAGIVGYPGPNALRGTITAMRKCEKIACG